MPTKKKPIKKKETATPKKAVVPQIEKETEPTTEQATELLNQETEPVSVQESYKKKFDEIKNNIMSNYNVHPRESHLYHVSLEKVKFDDATGERLSKAFVQKFNRREWANFQKYGDKGFTVKILWSPQNQ